MARIIVIAVLVIAVAIIGWAIGSAIARPSHRVTHDRPTMYALNQLIESNHNLSMALSEIGRVAGLSPGASSCEIQARVVMLVQEIAELKQEHGLLSGKLQPLSEELRGTDSDEA